MKLDFSQQTNIKTLEQESTVIPTSRKSRFVNYVIDTFPLFVTSFGYEKGFFSNSLFVTVWLFHLSNYLILESITGKTIGKYITKTRTINKDGSKASFGKILIKTLVRFIPFEVLSFLSSSNPVGWHDKLSGTKVIKESQFDKVSHESKGFESQHIQKQQPPFLITGVCLVLLIGGFLFYWFQWRPAEIRSYCHQWIVDLPGDVEERRSKSALEKYKALFERCLLEKGLK